MERRLAGVRVLLVDSWEDSRSMYAEGLQMAGAIPVELDRTTHALVRARDVHVVVTGVRVDGPFDGVELVRRLRQDDRTKDKALIVLTACTAPRDRARAIRAGCDLFLIKPCLPEDLIAEIQRLLHSRERRASAGARKPLQEV